jgi:signal transduction histidine kinase
MLHRLFLSSVLVWLITIILLLTGSAALLYQTQNQLIQKDLDRDVVRAAQILVDRVYRFDQETRSTISDANQLESILQSHSLQNSSWIYIPAKNTEIHASVTLRSDCQHAKPISNSEILLICFVYPHQRDQQTGYVVRSFPIKELLSELVTWDTHSRIWRVELPQLPIIESNFDEDIAAETWRAVTRLPFAGDFQELQVDLSLSDSDPAILGVIYWYWIALCGLIFLVFLGFIFLSWRQMRYNLAPLTRLAHEVSLVDSDYHDWSVWKHDFSDEVGVLQESLKKSFQNIQELNQHLEATVQMRTKALQETMLIATERAIQIQNLFELSPMGLIEVNEDNRLGLINKQAHLWLHLEINQVKTLEELESHVQKYIDIKGHRLTDLWSNDHVQELIGKTYVGSSKEIAFGCVREVGRVRLIYLRDISSQQSLERQRKDFLAATAHELRTPLSSIVGYAQLALKKSGDSQEHLRVIEKQALHMKHILKDLNVLFQTGAHSNWEYSFQREYFSSWLREFLDQNPLDQSRAWDISLTDNLRPVSIDPSRMAQVMLNLLSNAVKYSPAYSLIKISCHAAKLDSREGVMISVADSGMGISEQDQKEIFRPYFRANSALKFPGTGLGLLVVKEIVVAHKGELFIKSSPGQGTVVEFFLPYTLPIAQVSLS